MKLLISLLLVSVLGLGGCVATVQRGNASANAGTDGSAPDALAPIRVPAAGSKRLVLNITGEKVCTEAKDWVEFKKEWADIFAQQAGAAGMKFEVQDGAPHPLGEAGTLVSVHVRDYRFVGVGSRIMLGIMTGNAYVDARLKVIDLNGGTVYGDQTLNTSSSAWHGVFAAVTSKQIYAIADEVIGDIKGR